MNIGELTRQVTTDTQSLTQSLKEARQAMERLQRKMNGLTQAGSSFAGGRGDFGSAVKRLAATLENRVLENMLRTLETPVGTGIGGIVPNTNSRTRPDNTTTSGVESFRMSRGQMLAQLSYALNAGRRFL